MTRVYVDAGVLSTGGGVGRPADGGSVDSAAVRSLDHLIEAGHEVVLVVDPVPVTGTVDRAVDGAVDGAVPAPAAGTRVAGIRAAGIRVAGIPEALAATAVTAAPSEPTATTWYLTSDAERCRGRSARLRTILVGRSASPTAIHRCDSLARDVLAAVLEILAAEAMPPG